MKPMKNMVQHGALTPSGTEWLCGTGYTHTPQELTGGRFGRMFPTLSSTVFHPHFLHAIGANDGPMDGGQNANPLSNSIPAGFTFVGQFIDHDITFDTTSSLDRANDPRQISNGRTPALELDSVYGMGQERSPFLYQPRTAKLLLGGNLVGEQGKEVPDGTDLPRNSAKTALIGDPRNDENFFIGHLQLAFLKFHNAVVEALAPDHPDRHDLFAAAQREVRYHYQWMILHEYLPLIVGQSLVDDILRNGLRYYIPQTLGGHKPGSPRPFIPVEFSVAAFRFGHSQMNRDLLDANGVKRQVLPDFDNLHLPTFNHGFGKLNADPDVQIAWDQLFKVATNDPETAARIDTKLAPSLLKLPPSIVAADHNNERASLATRNLLRGNSFALPAGETLADYMGAQVLTAEEIDLMQQFEDFNMPTETGKTQTPLWYYILREAEVKTGGETLGPVGGRIVGEVLMGLLLYDPMSYLNADPNWVPSYGQDGQFTMADLITMAGLA